MPNVFAALLGDFDLGFPVAGTSNYVIMQNGMPALHALTVTFWMRTTDTANAGTPLSYATRNADGSVQDNAFTISDYNSIAIIINGDFMYTDVKLNRSVLSFKFVWKFLNLPCPQLWHVDILQYMSLFIIPV